MDVREVLHDQAEDARDGVPVIHIGAAAPLPAPDPCTWPTCECAHACEAPNAWRRDLDKRIE